MIVIKQIHKKCGGDISNRRCSKCGKHWNVLHFFLSREIKSLAKVLNEG